MTSFKNDFKYDLEGHSRSFEAAEDKSTYKYSLKFFLKKDLKPYYTIWFNVFKEKCKNALKIFVSLQMTRISGPKTPNYVLL